mgnify:CR=1 FL=1
MLDGVSPAEKGIWRIPVETKSTARKSSSGGAAPLTLLRFRYSSRLTIGPGAKLACVSRGESVPPFSENDAKRSPGAI